MKFISISILAMLLLCSCTEKQQQEQRRKLIASYYQDSSTPKNLGYLKLVGDSIEIPPFEIYLDVSDAAKEQLRLNKEKIIVRAEFSGTPKNLRQIDLDEFDKIYLLNTTQYLIDTPIAHFKGIRFPKQVFNALADNDIILLINIFGSRNSASYSLLNADIIHERLSKVLSEHHVLKVTLAEEH